MATYNGEKFIKKQIESILINLEENDELVISDDGSTDNTKEIIVNIKDHRIKLIDGPQKGLKKNFDNAIQNTCGDIIFLSEISTRPTLPPPYPQLPGFITQKSSSSISQYGSWVWPNSTHWALLCSASEISFHSPSLTLCRCPWVM